MVGIIIVGHGLYPEGLRNSAEMISGEMKQTETVSLEPEDDPFIYGQKLSEAINRVDTGDGVLVLADLRGGTPFNQSLMLCREKKIHIIVGTNLPLALVVNVSRNDKITLDELSGILLNAAPESIDLIKYDSKKEN